MFGFGKRSKLVPLDSDESKDEPQRTDNGSTEIASGYAATQSAQLSKQQAAKKFFRRPYRGNRAVYDSGPAKRQAKIDAFKDGKKVYDPHTGKELVPTVKEAKARWGEKWADHLAETDHLHPLERGVTDALDDPWVTEDNVSTNINGSDNTEVTSRKWNNAKRSRTNKELVEDDEYLKRTGLKLSDSKKKSAAQKGERAKSIFLRKNKRNRLENIVTTGHEAGMQGAQASGETTLTMSGIMNFVAVIKGEKTGEEAVTDTIKDAGKAAVTGYAMGGGLTVVSHTISYKGKGLIKALADSDIPGKVITTVMTIGDTLKRYANGEITTQECMIELGERGLNTVTTGYSMAVGQALIPIPIVGAAIGALVGSALTSSYYHNLINTLHVSADAVL